MTHIRGSLYINRPPAEVFDFVSDERNEPSFNRGMTSVMLTTPPPIGVGSNLQRDDGRLAASSFP